MANTLKKLLSLAIAVIMVLSLIPAVSAEEAITWNEISNEEEWHAWFGNYKDSKLLTEYGDGTPVYFKLTNSFTITCNKLQYIGLNSGSGYTTKTCKVVIDLGGNTLTYEKSATATGGTRFMGVYGTNDSQLTIQNGTLVNNAAYVEASGGLLFMNKGSIKLENLTITDINDQPYASSGKLLSVGSRIAELNNVTINANTTNSSANAGAINLSSGKLTMTDCTINGSETSEIAMGGLVYIGGGTTSMTNCTFNGGEAEYGAQLYVGAGTVNMTDCKFNGGKSTFGTVAIGGKSVVTMDGGYIANGVAESYTTVDAEGESTTTKAKGGNLWIYNDADKTTGASVTMNKVTVKDGVCDNIGGNIYISNKNAYAPTQLVMTDCIVSGGEGKNGGSIGMTSGARLSMIGGSVTGGKGSNGALIWTFNDTEADDSSVLTLNGVTLSDGNATGSGGAVYMQTSGTKAPCTAVLTDCTIKDCYAKTSGGAIFMSDAPVDETFTITNCTIENCESKDGGAVALSGKGTMGIYGGSISGCEASNAGGALWVYNSKTANTTGTKLIMDGLTVQNNVATGGNGGAIYSSNAKECIPAVIQANNVTFDGNQTVDAGNFGGNIYFAGATFTDAEGVQCKLQATFTNSTIKNGVAEGFGGNIGLAGSAQVTLNGTTVENGVTLGLLDPEKCGGGNLYIGNSSATLTMIDSEMLGGQTALYGGNIRLGSGCVVVDQNSKIEGGFAAVTGHTIYLNETAGARVYLYDGTINATALIPVNEEGSEEETITPEAIFVNKEAKLNLLNGTAIGFDAAAYTVYGESYAIDNGDGTYTVKHYAVDGATTKTASCTEAGTITIECANCARTYVYENEAGHAIVLDKAVAATCTDDGLTEGSHCALCDQATVAQNVITASGHDKESVTYTAPETEGAGSYTYACSACKEVQETVAATDVVKDVALATVTTGDSKTDVGMGSYISVQLDKLATGDKAGLAIKLYSGETLLSTTVYAKADGVVTLEKIKANIELTRNSGSWDTTWEEGQPNAEVVPTKIELWYNDELHYIYNITTELEGWATYEGVANGRQHVPGEAVEENKTDATCKDPGSVEKVIYCTGCGFEISRENVPTEINPNAHTEKTVPGKDATCKEPGLTEGKICSVCGETLVAQEPTDLAEHTWGEPVNYISTCSVCGETKEVKPAFMITAQPEDTSVTAGEKATFTVAAEGVGVTYCWRYSRDGINWYNTTMEGAKTATLTVPALVSRNGYKYYCVLTDETGAELVSEIATLTVAAAELTVADPESVTVTDGDTAQFTVGHVDGYKYSWQYSRDGGTTWYETGMAGYNTATLSVPAPLARNGYQYRCVVSDGNGSQKTSAVATLTVEKQVTTITTQPAAATAENGTAVFSVVVEGKVRGYRWQYSRDGGTTWYETAMTGYNTDTLTVAAIPARDGYCYKVQITDQYGQVIFSDMAELTVN